MFFNRLRGSRLLALLGILALTSALALPVVAQVENPVLEVTATDATATEAGPTTGHVTLTRTGDLTAALDVDYTVTGTATAGDDYVALSGTASFAAGAATSIVTVTPVDDSDVEGDETVILTLDVNAAYELGDDIEATVTIQDNDEAPLPSVEVTASDLTATEEGTTTGAYTFTRTGDLTAALDVDYTVTGTATSGDDYVALSGTASFAAGAATSIVTVTPVDDSDVEGNETVIVTLDANAAYTIGDDDQATVTIEDNDEAAPLPSVEVTASDAIATEEGTTTGVYTFTRTGDLTDALSVDYTVTGTATSGDDYVALTGTATIAAGAATTNIVVLPVDDSDVEGNETVILTLDANAAYTIGDDDQATITIEDNDDESALAEITVTATDDTATEEGTTTGAYTFTRTGDLSAALDVDYTVTGTATSGDDYVALSGTASFAAGEATSIVTVTPIDDSDVEGDETVIVTLDVDAAYTIGDDDQATITIEDNDEEMEEPTDPMPLSKDDCKKGGWIDFGVFKNQGDCVSYVATGGKNPPAFADGDDSDEALSGPPPFIMRGRR